MNMIMSAAKKLPKKIGRIKIHVNPWAMPKLKQLKLVRSTVQVASSCIIWNLLAKYASAAEEP